MEKGIFIINGRYRICPMLNQLQDQLNGQTTHLEPRIMAVLINLSQRAGQLVTREEMILNIWNNYGGGDEGLSQAVSFLRKVLNDGNKNLIKTIPKKGYCLSANLSVDEVEKLVIYKSKTKLTHLKSVLRFMVATYVIGTGVYFIHNNLYQHLGVNQNSSFATSSEPGQLRIIARDASKKFLKIKTNNKTSYLAMNKRVASISGDQKVPVHNDNLSMMSSAGADTKTYNLKNATAQLVTALDYQITTTLQISTTIN